MGCYVAWLNLWLTLLHIFYNRGHPEIVEPMAHILATESMVLKTQRQAVALASQLLPSKHPNGLETIISSQKDKDRKLKENKKSAMKTSPLTDFLLLSQIPCISPSSHQTLTASFSNFSAKKLLLSSIAPIAFALSLNSPLPSLAIPPPVSQTSSTLPPTTPYSQAKNFQIGLENGKIRACPSVNPGCISTNPKSSSFAFPWVIPENASETAVERLMEAILKTQKNAKIQVNKETPDGQYLQAEVDGGFGRDVMEFLIKRDVVAYRSMATKVTYVYPFTTALGDSKGQKERINKIVEELGWSAPSFESMDQSEQGSPQDYLQ